MDKKSKMNCRALKVVELEIQYAHDVLPTGIIGLNAEMFVDYMHYIGNRRLEAIGLEYIPK